MTSLGSSAMRAAGMAAIATILVAACSGSGDGSAGGSVTPVGPASTPAGPAAAPTGAPASAGSGGGSTASLPAAYVVSVAQDPTLGAYLVGEDGRALYLLTKDSADTTTCAGACAQAWPPFELDGGATVSAGAGVTGSLGTITRPEDGSQQVTYAGVPLYYFAGDSKAGDVNGQGFNGVWFLVAPGSGATAAGITGWVGASATVSGGATASPAPTPTRAGYTRGTPSGTPATASPTARSTTTPTVRPTATPTPRPRATATASPTATSGTGATASVTIAGFAFVPASVTVAVGTTVTWTNTDPVGHTVTANGGSFGSGTIPTGASFSYKFGTAGTYAFHCSIHPSMTGTITVTG
jgi:plastocyanin/predicted lipoprotein with Yx(FWY)xxD motif